MSACYDYSNLGSNTATNFVAIECPNNSDMQLRVYCWNSNWYASVIWKNISRSTLVWEWRKIWCTNDNLKSFSLVRYYSWGGCKVKYSSDKICEWTFEPVISWLTNSMNEFIPYVAYIGLWILSVIIWFVAIKWLINRVRAKVLGTFKR